jgi:hypothetical protein
MVWTPMWRWSRRFDLHSQGKAAAYFIVLFRLHACLPRACIKSCLSGGCPFYQGVFRSGPIRCRRNNPLDATFNSAFENDIELGLLDIWKIWKRKINTPSWSPKGVLIIYWGDRGWWFWRGVTKFWKLLKEGLCWCLAWRRRGY